MKTHLLKTIICLVAFGLLTTGCQHTTQKEADNAVKFDSILVDKTYHLLDNPENPNCNLQIKFTYPVSVENDLLADIQKQFVLAYFGEAYENLSPKDAVEKYQNDYLAAYKELEPDYEEELKRAEDGTPVGAWFSYYELSSNQIQFNQNDLISFTVNF